MKKRKPSIVGNYKFTGKTLGKGNFAKVEEAVHELLGTKVAVKIMDLNSIQEDYVVRNLFREAKIMAQLKHPCIVSLFETMQRADNVYYLITEIVNGGDLCTYVKAQKCGKLDEKSAKFFGQQFVSALAYMHQKGIVHRDLKMENVMLNSVQNLIKIVDFGLSNEWTMECPLKTHCGSPEYAAPELFVTNKVYGPEVDLWSLGIILYGMVVGQLPFVSNKTPSISSQERRKLLVAQINRGISTAQRKAIAAFSYEFRSLMNRLLDADAKKRINIKEMTQHPWITENGRKAVRVSPARKMTHVIYSKIMNEMSSIMAMGPNETAVKIKAEPYGKIGGIYNVLLHKYTIKPFNAEQIVRNCANSVDSASARSSAETSWGAPEVPRSSMKKHSGGGTEILEQRKVQSARAGGLIRKVLVRPQTTCGTAGGDLGKTKTCLTNNKMSLFKKHGIIPCIKLSEPRISSRPQSINTKRDDVNRPASSALQKRQEYSAMVASRLHSKGVTGKVKPQQDQIGDSSAVKKRGGVDVRTPHSPGVSNRSPSPRNRKKEMANTNLRHSQRMGRNNSNSGETFESFMKLFAPNMKIPPNNKSTEVPKSTQTQRSKPTSMAMGAVRNRQQRSSFSVEKSSAVKLSSSVVPVKEIRQFKSARRVLDPEQVSKNENASNYSKNFGSYSSQNHRVNKAVLTVAPKSASARGDFEKSTRYNTETNYKAAKNGVVNAQNIKERSLKITENILNYLQRNQFCS